MPDVAQLVVEVDSHGVVTSVKNLDDFVKKSKETEGATGKMNGEFSKFQKSVIVMNQGIELLKKGYDKIKDVVGESVRQFMQADAVSAKLSATLRATGGAAGKTVEDLENLADRLSGLTTYDDDAIKGLEAILLTFKSVQGEVFDRATQDALDLSAAFGGDLQSSAVMLGKALEDPTQGLLALRRVGVSFTQSQQEMIKSMQDAGRSADAQNLILKTLEGQVGGVAEALGDTASGKIIKFQQSIEDLQKAIGKLIATDFAPLIQGLTKVVNITSGKDIDIFWTPVLQGLDASKLSLDQIKEALKQIDEVKQGIRGAYGSTAGVLEQGWLLTTGKELQAKLEEQLRLRTPRGDEKGQANFRATSPPPPSKNEVDAWDALNKALKDFNESWGAVQNGVDDGRLTSAWEGQSDALKSYIETLEKMKAQGKPVDDFLQEHGKTLAGLVKQYQELQKHTNGTSGINRDPLMGMNASEYNKSFADQYGIKPENVQADIALVQLFGVAVDQTFSSAIRQADELNTAISGIGDALKQIAEQGFVDAFEAIGQAWSEGSDAGKSFNNAMAQMVEKVVDALPLLFLQAGLSLIAQGQWALGLGFIGASVGSAIGAGAMHGEIAKQQKNNATGNAYNEQITFAAQGIITTPRRFTFSQGAGLAGEAGPEGILPLSRMSNGDLGVQTSGSEAPKVTVNVINNTNEKVQTNEKDGPDGKQIEVIIGSMIDQRFASGKMDKVMGNRYGVSFKGLSKT